LNLLRTKIKSNGNGNGNGNGFPAEAGPTNACAIDWLHAL